MKVGIVIGTNRKDSFSSKIAQYYENQIKEHGHEVDIMKLEELPADFIFSVLYQKPQPNPVFADFQNRIDASERIVFIVPEYNGSYPGVLKAFIDGLRHPNSLSGKKACLVGLSAGVLGNAVGLGHLNDVLAYLNANVLGLRMKLGEINKHFENGAFVNDVFEGFVKKQISNFLNF